MGVVKTWNGIDRASLKTFGGNAIASVKTINGFDATSGGTTYTLEETLGGDSSDSPAIADNGIRTFVTGRMVAGSSYTITKIEIRMKRNGAGVAPDLVCEIRASTGTQPDTPPLATSTNTVVSADVATTQGWITFYFTGLAITSGVTYYIGVKALSVDAANNYTARSGSFGTGEIMNSTLGTTTWAASGSRPWYQRTYSSP